MTKLKIVWKGRIITIDSSGQCILKQMRMGQKQFTVCVVAHPSMMEIDKVNIEWKRYSTYEEFSILQCFEWILS